MPLSDAQWNTIRHHFPEEADSPAKPGRKPVPARRILEAVIWILKTGAQWHMLPQSFPNYKTVHRRFQKWCVSEVIRNILCDLANQAREQDAGEFDEAYIDAMFVPARMAGEEIGYGYKGKGTKIMAIVDRKGLPTAVAAYSNEHHEVKLVQLTLDLSVVEVSPERLIGDTGFDSDRLDEELRSEGIEMIAPHKRSRKKKSTQDQRLLRRMRRRFTVERTFSWLKWSRRIAQRWDYYWSNFLGFVELACVGLYLKRI